MNVITVYYKHILIKNLRSVIMKVSIFHKVKKCYALKKLAGSGCGNAGP